MTYYLLRLLAKLIPGGARRQRFIEWARPRFSVQAIVDIALADRLQPIERAIYRTQSVEAPLTLTIDETLDALIDGRSIARFGDGELSTMEGKFDVFQTPGDGLTRRLEEVLSHDEPGLLIAIPVLFYELDPNLTDEFSDWYQRAAPYVRGMLRRHLAPERTYAAAEVTQAHSMYRPTTLDRRAYFDRVRKIWEGANVVLIHGDGIFDGFTHDIFDNAASVDHILAPKRDAFDHYDDILQQAMQTPPGSLIIAILGPTATVLAYDLHRAGYRALDLGHIAKSYDWWLRGRTTDETMFFAD